MSALYEVKLEIDAEAREEFLAWIAPHMREVLATGCFVAAQMYRQVDSAPDRQIFVCHYHARSTAEIHEYIDVKSAPLRADGVRRFGTRMRAERRILDLTESLTESQIVTTHRKDNS